MLKEVFFLYFQNKHYWALRKFLFASGKLEEERALAGFLEK